jgi:MFS family permease
VLFGTGMVLQIGVGAIIPCLPAYTQSIGLPESSIGLLVAVPSFARVLLNLPAGCLADLVGRKRPMVVGTLMDGAGCIGTALAGTLPGIAASRLLMGSGAAIAGNAASAYTMDVVNKFPLHRGRIMGGMQSAGALAFVLGPVLGGFLAERGGIALPFVLVGATCFATVPLIQLLLPETRPPPPGSSLSSLELRPVIDEALRSFAELLRDRNQRALLCAQCGLFTGWSVRGSVPPDPRPRAPSPRPESKPSP